MKPENRLNRSINKEGHDMEMFLNNRLRERVQEFAARLHESDQDKMTVPATEQENGPAFTLSRSSEGLTTLMTLEVEGTTFYLGTEE